MRNKDIVCISMTTWAGDYAKAVVQMMSQLARDHRVLFVDYAYSWKDFVKKLFNRSKAPTGRMLGFQSPLRVMETAEGAAMYHLTLPPVLPINWIPSHKWFKRLLLVHSFPVVVRLKKTLKKLGFQDYVMINAFNPAMGNAIYPWLRPASTIYYCYDEIREAEWVGRHGGPMEEAFIPKTDAVVVTSQSLYENRKNLHPNVHLVKNGVDFNLFARASERTDSCQKKIIGFMGSIDHRVDVDLLESMMARKPEWKFHFVGRVNRPEIKERLQRFENTTFFGPMQPAELPRVLSRFDVGIIPFVCSTFTKNIYPLKINEYLAAGKPVVVTPFADLTDFFGHISIAADADKMINAIDEALDEDSLDKRKSRMALAANNSWSHRSQEFNQIIGEVA